MADSDCKMSDTHAWDSREALSSRAGLSRGYMRADEDTWGRGKKANSLLGGDVTSLCALRNREASGRMPCEVARARVAVLTMESSRRERRKPRASFPRGSSPMVHSWSPGSVVRLALNTALGLLTGC